MASVNSQLASERTRLGPPRSTSGGQPCTYRLYLSRAQTEIGKLEQLLHQPEPTRSKSWRSCWSLAQNDTDPSGLIEPDRQKLDTVAHQLDRLGQRVQAHPHAIRRDEQSGGASIGESMRDLAFLTHLTIFERERGGHLAPDQANRSASKGERTHADSLLWSFVNSHLGQQDSSALRTGDRGWLNDRDLRRGRAALSAPNHDVQIPCTERERGCSCFHTPNTLRLTNQRLVRSILGNTDHEGENGSRAGMRDTERTLLQTALSLSEGDFGERYGLPIEDLYVIGDDE